MAMGAKKKTTAKKPAKKGAAHAKTTAKKPAKKAAPAAKRKAAAKAPARRFTPAEELANRILAAMDDEKNLDLGKFYTEDVVSVEPAGGSLTGLQSLRSKLAGWLAGLRSSNWKARHVFVSKNAVCIEWEADLVMKDGRQITLSEVAVHELRGEKICKERFYYDPRALMPPAAVVPPTPPRPPAPAPAKAKTEVEGPGIDPMDL
jgi:ketosteroid isomerase-like protein